MRHGDSKVFQWLARKWPILAWGGMLKLLRPANRWTLIFCAATGLMAALGCETNKEPHAAYPDSSNFSKNMAVLHEMMSPQPHSVETTRDLTEEESSRKKVLNIDEQARIRAAFAELARGRTASNPPAKSLTGRWSDVPLAVYYACEDVELTTVTTTEHEWGYEYTLRTIEEWPGRLMVKRGDGDRVFSAEAFIGWDDERRHRAAALLRALDKQMRAFARKRGFDQR